MNVLVTGGFGNVGSSAVMELVGQGHQVRCFDVPTRRSRQLARRCKRQYGNQVEIAWGDVRDAAAVRAAVGGMDVVVHTAFIIPPASERNPDLAQAVNVTGTRNIVQAIQQTEPAPNLIFTSSVAIYGHQQNSPPPRTADDPVQATDGYTAHKIACEKMIRESDVVWSIYRLSAVQPLSLSNVDPLLFEVPLQQRIEFVHTHDVGLAIAKGVDHSDIWYKTLLIAGGERCQMTFREYLGTVLDALGIRRLPDEAFTTEPFHTDWMDTAESQRLLQYQRYTYPQFVHQMLSQMGYQRVLARWFSPLAYWWMLRQSPYYRRRRDDG